MTESRDDHDMLAGELALRVLSPADEAAARARQASDPVFAAEVEAWAERLGKLIEEVPEAQPSPAVWPRISAALGAANDNAVIFWKRWAYGSTGLLAASVAALVVMLAQSDPAPVGVQAPTPEAMLTRVATLSLEGGGTAATLIYDPATNRLFLQPAAPMPAEGRVPHLWLVMEDGGVRLIGQVDGATASRRTLDAGVEVMAGEAAAVAISMEAPGHTPAIDRPDGPVVASGEFETV
ncbi:MAG: anti-sigma factor domain-containing protein [Brevundimonas sp.]|uniref:anti-sigma factor n=1 Tax=Brevundimonas sp. TaxID=1871086 RepID=UPI003918CDDD